MDESTVAINSMGLSLMRDHSSIIPNQALSYNMSPVSQVTDTDLPPGIAFIEPTFLQLGITQIPLPLIPDKALLSKPVQSKNELRCKVIHVVFL